MARTQFLIAGLFGLMGAAAACSASSGSDDVFNEGDGGAGVGGSTGGATGGVGTGNTGTGGLIGVGGSNGGSTGTTCDNPQDVDDDMDGWTEQDGDCNDCDANVNPGALEVIITDVDPMTGMPPEPADEDCDGTVDNPPPTVCDTGIPVNESDPMQAAKVVDLCKTQSGPDDWGVVSANWVRANGASANVNNQMGVLPNFGPNVNPQGGDNMLGLSSGQARLPADHTCQDFSCPGSGPGTAPAGFPQNAGNCPIGTLINDDVGLEVTLKAPSNATGYSFNFKFYTFEYPEWVCDFYNDQFISLVNPPPAGALNGNVSFDSQNNPVSVNVAFFDVCPGCPLGTAELAGTGFDGSFGDDAGGTGWLQTQVPVGGGEVFSIRWAIWDTQDALWDSTVLVDNFQWIANGGTVVVGTDPVPVPK